MNAGGSAWAEAELAEGERHLVEHDEGLLGRDLVEAREGSDGLSAEVHEG